MSPRALSIFRSFALITVCLTLFACAAPIKRDSHMPGLKVVGDRQDLFIGWAAGSPVTKYYPVGTSMELLADFQTERGESITAYRLARGRVVQDPSSKARVVRFALPDRLDFLPDRNMCLYARSRNAVRPLPVRTAGGTLGTEGFHYQEWETATIENSRFSIARARVDSLRTEKRRRQSEVRHMEKVIEERGYADSTRCRSINTKLIEDQLAGISNSVVPRDQHAKVAKSVCTYRVQRFDHENGLQLEKRLNQLFVSHKQNPQGLTKLQEKKLRELKDVVNNGYSTLLKGYLPPFQLSAGNLGISAATISSWRNEKKVLALVGLRDAYQACRGDLVKQLEDELQTWESARRTQGQRSANAQRFVIQACNRLFQDYEQTKKNVAEVDQLLKDAESAFPALKESRKDLPREKDLTLAACARLL